jgi:Na+-translocating ferredoxin:NAD+ oxidoreductase subunit D
VPDKRPILLGPSPHIVSGIKTPQVMLMVIMALIPSAVNGVWLFGLNALAVMLVSVSSAVLWELLFQLATKQKPRIGDLSAVITGLLIALIVPPSLPPWMAAIGTFFAIVVAKEFFGGLGANPFNPALVGRAILLMSFPTFMTRWHKPGIALTDALASATPLGLLRAKEAVSATAAATDAAFSNLTGPMAKIGAALGVGKVEDIYRILFFGNRPGSIGETSILLILAGGLFLIALRVIGPSIPISILASTALFSWALGVDPLFAVLSGGVAFGAFFMATDYSSSPITPAGKWIYGACVGLIIVLIRRFGSFPEGVTYAILIMNAVAPFLDKLRVRKYGYLKPAKAPKASKEGAK